MDQQQQQTAHLELNISRHQPPSIRVAAPHQRRIQPLDVGITPATPNSDNLVMNLLLQGKSPVPTPMTPAVKMFREFQDTLEEEDEIVFAPLSADPTEKEIMVEDLYMSCYIPAEILSYIFDYSDLQDVYHLMNTCKSFFDIITQEHGLYNYLNCIRTCKKGQVEIFHRLPNFSKLEPLFKNDSFCFWKQQRYNFASDRFLVTQVQSIDALLQTAELYSHYLQDTLHWSSSRIQWRMENIKRVLVSTMRYSRWDLRSGLENSISEIKIMAKRMNRLFFLGYLEQFPNTHTKELERLIELYFCPFASAYGRRYGFEALLNVNTKVASEVLYLTSLDFCLETESILDATHVPLLQNFDFVKQVIPKQPHIIQQIPASIWSDRKLFLQCITAGGVLSKGDHILQHYKEDEEVLLACIKNNPFLYTLVGEHWRKDREFAYKATQLNETCFLYLPREFSRNLEFIKEVVRNGYVKNAEFIPNYLMDKELHQYLYQQK